MNTRKSPLGVVELYSERQERHYGTQTPIDELYDLLRHPERRAVVRVLSESDPISFDELAERIAPDRTEEAIDRTRIALYHHHLPRFENAGVVEHDDSTGIVTFAPVPEKHQIVRLAEDLS